jgi:hypothetical protein
VLKRLFQGRLLLNAGAHAPMTVFVWFWAWVMLFQAYYDMPLATALPAFDYFTLLAVHKPLEIAALLLSLLLIAAPRLYDIFFLLIAVTVIQFWLLFPVNSNHMFMEFVFMTAACLVFAASYAQLRAAGPAGWREAYRRIAPIGRWVLLIMYFFGIFHKINTDFLDPAASCAVTLWRLTPFMPQAIAESPFFHQAAIYGTFAAEGLAMALLMGPARYRHWGIITGIFFHSFIGINQYVFYSPFTLLGIGLHSLFLTPTTAGRLCALGRILFRGRNWLRWALAAAVFAFFLYMFDRQTASYNSLRIFQALLTAAFAGAILLVRRPVRPRDALTGAMLLRTQGVIAPLAVTLFFLNGWLPYVGLKTGQSLAMFSNLRTERGETNHLLMPDAWLSLFPFQQRVVKVLEAKHASFLEGVAAQGGSMTDYSFRAWLAAYPEAEVTFIDADGKKVHLARAGDAPEWQRPEPHFLRKLMVFRILRDERPVACAPN